MERPDQRAYRGGWEKYINANYRRVIEVWFDEYKRYVYEVMPHIKVNIVISLGDKAIESIP
jgi:hypothetical protein